MAQTTSVNANNSLILRRASGLPTGAFTVTLQGRIASWTGNANQNIILVEGPSGQRQIYAHLDGGEIRVWNGSAELLLFNTPPSHTDWAMYYLRWAGSGQSVRCGVVIGGVSYEVTSPEVGNISDVQVMGLTFAGSNQSNQLHACSFGVFASYYSDADLLALALVDTPPGGVANGWCPMSSAATVGTASIGTSATVSGTGADVTDSPYSTAHDLGASDLVAGAATLDTTALGQVHALTATGLASGTPELGTPALGTLASLGAADLAAGTPSLGAAALGQVHPLGASNVTAGVPLLGAAALNAVGAALLPARGTLTSLQTSGRLSATPIPQGNLA
jgi:hypothetical protein